MIMVSEVAWDRDNDEIVVCQPLQARYINDRNTVYVTVTALILAILMY